AESINTEAEETVEEQAEACGAVLRALGARSKAVLDAETVLLPGWPVVPPERVVLFARDRKNRRLIDHCAAGGAAVFLREGMIVLAHAGDERTIRLGERDQLGEQEVIGLLAALAGAMALDLSVAELQTYVEEEYVGDILVRLHPVADES